MCIRDSYKVFGKNEIWVKQLSGDEIAVCLFNRDDHFSWNLDIDWQKEDFSLVGVNPVSYTHLVTTIREDAIRYGVKVLASGKSFKKVLPVSKDTISQRYLCGDMKWMMTRK